MERWSGEICIGGSKNLVDDIVSQLPIVITTYDLSLLLMLCLILLVSLIRV